MVFFCVKGLGYDENDIWSVHEKRYNELLQQLGERMNGTGENLESKSNSSDKHSLNLTEQRNRYMISFIFIHKYIFLCVIINIYFCNKYIYPL